MVARHGALSVALVVISCAATSAGGQQCAIGASRPVSASDGAAQLTGVFDLEWRPGPGEWKRTPRRERLWLWPTSPSDSALEANHRHPASGDTTLYLLFGTVTARTVPPLARDSLRATVDPIYAPVYLRVLGDRSRDDFALAVLVGTVDDRDPTLHVPDGAGDFISIARIGPRGFAGSYGPWGNALLDTGTACAVRVR